MILRFLRLFMAFRRVESALASFAKENEQLAHEVELSGNEIREGITERIEAERSASFWEAKCEAAKESIEIWKDRCLKAESQRDAVVQDRDEKMTLASDSLALRLNGCRMFSKAPVEAPPQQESNQPINLFGGKRMIQDVQRESNAEFFRRQAARSQVIPEDSDQKPN